MTKQIRDSDQRMERLIEAWRGLHLPPLFLSAVLVSISLATARAETTPGSKEDLRDGYFLLHKTCKQESQVSMITWIKTTPPNVTDFVKQVASAGDDSVHILEKMAEKDPSLGSGPNPLPPFEQAARLGISKEEEKLLIFGSKGKAFARRLLTTQIEACNYIVNDARTWAQRDHDASRIAAMTKLAGRWAGLRDKAYALIDTL